MDKTESKRAFIEYRNAVRARHSNEDAEIMRGYKALAKGQQLINLPETIKAGGLELKARRGQTPVMVPRLAAMRADQEWCYLVTQTNGAIEFNAAERRNKKAERVRIHAGTFDNLSWSRSDFRALVPPIPPQFRPSIALSNFHVLWEAEWQKCAPKDPALLRHIGGDLYAVLAVWDLTELERSVLMRRFAS